MTAVETKRAIVGRRKRRRLYVISTGIAMLGIAVALVLNALEDNIVFFYSPSEVKVRGIMPGKNFRIGGLVKEGTISKSQNGLITNFEVTDLDQSVTVSYKGILPDLFREGQGVVAEGKLQRDGIFNAREVLAKHDENYMPPEVAEALKKSGKWKATSEINIRK